MNVDKVQQWLLRIGWLISAVLMIRFLVDFTVRMSWWLGLPFCVLVIGSLALGLMNIFSSGKAQRSFVVLAAIGRKSSIAWGLLLAAIPISLFTSSLDCTGLSLYGCSPFCTFIKLVWIPVIGVLCATYFVLGKAMWLMAINLSMFVALVPHCVCYNVGNGWWINVLGASPLCYGWGFLVSVLVAGAIRSRANLGPSLVISLAIVIGSIGFFVSHHYFQYPW